MDAKGQEAAGRNVGGAGRRAARGANSRRWRPPGTRNVIEDAWHGGCRVRRAFSERSLRPGGTISGPTMMGLTDFAMYVAILASIGPVPLAVTTNLNINFLRKPAQRDLIAEVRLIKLGKRLAVGEVADLLRRRG